MSCLFQKVLKLGKKAPFVECPLGGGGMAVKNLTPEAMFFHNSANKTLTA